MKQTKRCAAAVFAAVIAFSSCGLTNKKAQDEEPEAPVTTTVTTSGTTETETETAPVETVEPEEDPEEEELPDRVRVSLGMLTADELDEKSIEEIKKAVGALEPVGNEDITFADCGEDLRISVYSDGCGNNYDRMLSDKGWVIVDSHLNVYKDSEELSKLAVGAVTQSVKPAGSTENYYTIECDEPSTEEEYVDAAVKCCEAWLTSLQSEDTDKYYRNKGFDITVTEEESGHQKCNYLSSGMVDGKKEFVVEICFKAIDCGDDTFYDEYYQEGRYTEAGTYWSGNYICGRFRWENGECTLLRIETRDGSEALQSGLNGIQEPGGYKNFFEFARRPDYKKAVEDSFVPYGRCTVSANLTQTEDGKPINVDIYTSSVENETKDGYTAIWDQRAYMDGEATYSTGLYFTDNGTGHMPDTLPKQFDLTFDNYDGDANPDFCCRYDSDSDGTYYVLESVQTDGRIFNLSGRAFEGGIYIAGCTDPSPRLQRTDNIPYIGWKKDETGYYPTDNNGNQTDLPDLNMYSDRFFLPGDLRLYSEDEDSVTCFLWNNTGSEIKTGSTYSIEKSENGEWKTVAEGLSCKGQTVNPREHAEMTFDISSVKDRYNTVYRIVLKCGDKKAYGSFWLDGKEVSSIEITAQPLTLGSSGGSFTVKDNGFTDTEIKSAAITDGKETYPLKLYASGDYTYQFVADKLPEKAGKYTLTVNDSASTKIEFREAADIPEMTTEAKVKDEAIELSLTCSKDCELTDIITYKKIGDDWSATPFRPGDGAESYLKKNKKFTVKLENHYADYYGDEELESMYEEFRSDIEEEGLSDEVRALGIDENTTLDEFKEIIKKYLSADPDAEYMFVIDYVVDDRQYQMYRTI